LGRLAVARTIGLDANANKTWGIPNRQKAGNLQHEHRQPGKSAILAAARGPRNLTWKHPTHSGAFAQRAFSPLMAKQKRMSDAANRGSP